MYHVDDPKIGETILRLKLCEVEYRPQSDENFLKLNDFTFFLY